MRCHGCRPASSACRARCRALVGRAGRCEGEPARAALEEVIRDSWGPVHTLVRRAGFRGPDAEDLTQAYFTRFLEKRYDRCAATWTGCFRPFLRTTVRHFLSNHRDHEGAAKRGGRMRPISLDALGEKGWAPPALRLEATPETQLSSRQAAAAIARAVGKLAAERRAAGQGDRFAQLNAWLLDGAAPRGYAALAADWGVGESAVRVAVLRLRRRLAQLLREGEAPLGALSPRS